MSHNPYQRYLIAFFAKVLDYRHTTDRLCRVLIADAKKYEPDTAVFNTNSSLIISDLSGPTDNGWELNFHTKVFRQTLKEHYGMEIDNLVSRECCYTYAQSFEAFETFLKDLLYYEATIDLSYKLYLTTLLPKNHELTRKSMPGGEKLYKALNKCAGPVLRKLFAVNNNGLKHRETFHALSQGRHAIVHTRSVIDISKVNNSDFQLDTFKYFFELVDFGDGFGEIRLDVKRYHQLTKRFSEYAYQIFKAISITRSFEYDYELLNISESFTSGPLPNRL